MSQVHPIDPDGTGQAICPGILPRTLKCGPTGIIILSNFFKSLFKFFFGQLQFEFSLFFYSNNLWSRDALKMLSDYV